MKCLAQGHNKQASRLVLHTIPFLCWAPSKEAVNTIFQSLLVCFDLVNESQVMIWYSGLTALFLLILANAALAFLTAALSVALRPLFLFQQAQYAHGFLLNPAPFCNLFAGLRSTNKSAASLRLLSDSRFVLTTLSSPPSFLLPQSLWQMWQKLSSLSSCSIRLQ